MVYKSTFVNYDLPRGLEVGVDEVHEGDQEGLEQHGIILKTGSY